MKSFAIAALLVLSACSSSSDPAKSNPTPEDGGTTPLPAGKPVSAADFCDRVADVVCSSESECCSAGSAGWPGADDCVTKQVAACRGTIGDLVEDPRTGYDATAGGKVVAALEAAAKGCFAEPISVAQVTTAFKGTGELGANCTPESTSSHALMISALSCSTGSSCRLYLKGDGSPMGVCEDRKDDSCSHAFDCPSNQWCDLPAGWKPGVWGECHPLRTDGWSCASDRECQSSFCDASRRCAPAGERRYCLSTPYDSAVKADAPLAYLRLGGSASDASGNGLSATQSGDPESVTPGALAEDDNPATHFDGADDQASIAAGSFSDSNELSIELWFSRTESSLGQPLLAFGDDTVGGPVIAIDGEGAVTVTFADTDDNAHVLSSGDAHPGPDAWHHLLVSYDGLTATMLLDGKSVATLKEAFTVRLSGELHLGFAAPQSRFLGALDEVAIYPKALKDGRTLLHYQIGKKGPERTWPLFSWFE